MRDTSARVLIVLGLLAAGCGGEPFAPDLDTESRQRALGEAGTGPAPLMQLSTRDLFFNTIQIGSSATMTFTVRNVGPAGSVLQVGTMQLTGSLPGEFTIVQQGCTSPVQAGFGCDVTVRAAPAATGPRLASISFITNDPTNFVGFVTMNTIGVGAIIRVTPPTIDFGSRLVGTTTELPLTITNTGNLFLFLNPVVEWTTGPGSFAFPFGGCGAVAPGASCTVQIRFSPSTSGPQSASFRVLSDSPGTPPTVSLIGSGTSPARLEVSPTELDFGDVLLGSSAARELTFSNTGGSAMEVPDLGISGEFSVAAGSCGSPPFQLAPGVSCTVTMVFTPTAAGSLASPLFFPATGQQVWLFGTGVARADLQISMAGPAEAKVKDDITYTITVTNAGPHTAADVVVSDALPDVTTFVSVLADGFSCTTPPPGANGTVSCQLAALGAGESRTVTVVAHPFEGGKTTITNTAIVSSSTSDPESANDSASVETELKGKR